MSCPRIRKVTYSLSKKQKRSKRNGKRSRKARGLSNTVSNRVNSVLTSKSVLRLNSVLSNTVRTNSSIMSNLPEFSGYKAQREFLDDSNFIRLNPLTSYPRRGKTGPHYFTTIIAGSFDTCSGNDLTLKQVKAFREVLQSQFPNAVSSIKSYNGVDQGEEGACSFVGFLNLTILSGNKSLFKPKNIHKSWNRIWNTFGIDSAADIGQVLDKILESRLFKDNVNISDYITYIPIRSEKNREMSFNKSFYKTGSKLEEIKDKYLGDNSKKDEIYEQVSWIYQNANLIESLIDSGKPVTINALEHTRTCIGYNDDELLFADNWIKTYEQISANGTDDHFRAGFSTINKWAIYSWMRDIVYYQ